MTPADHYREAERILGTLKPGDTVRADVAAANLAKAQVHATLALVGATALETLVGHDVARGDLGDALLGREPLHGRQPWERTIGRPATEIHIHGAQPETIAEVAARRAREAGR